MKITARQYAKTLYELTKDKNHEEINGIISQLVDIFRKNSQLRLKNDIIKRYEEIYNQEKRIVSAKVFSRKKLDGEMEKEISEFIKKKYKAEKVEIENNIDESIKGGIIIRIGDEVLDGSLDRKLKELKSALEK